MSGWSSRALVAGVARIEASGKALVPPTWSMWAWVSTRRRTGWPSSATAAANGSHWERTMRQSTTVSPSSSAMTPALLIPEPPPGCSQRAISSDAVYADCSTVSPALSSELAAQFALFVALPILGSPAVVEAGQAIYLAGGDPAVVARLEPMLATLSDKIRRYDTPAMAACGKLANNLMLLAEVVALAEAIAVARAGGLSDDEIR